MENSIVDRTVKFFVDADGIYQGSTYGDIPDNFFEVSNPPIMSILRWKDGQWVHPPQRFYVDSDGNYYGSISSWENYQGDYIEVISAPEFLYQKWNFINNSWEYEFSLKELSDYRKKSLSIDINVILSDGRSLVLKNDDQTKLALREKKDTIINKTDVETMSFKCENGWFDLNYNDYQEIGIALDLFTQKSFDAERHIESNNLSSPYVNDSWKQDFDDFMGQ